MYFFPQKVPKALCMSRVANFVPLWRVWFHPLLNKFVRNPPPSLQSQNSYAHSLKCKNL